MATGCDVGVGCVCVLCDGGGAGADFPSQSVVPCLVLTVAS